MYIIVGLGNPGGQYQNTRHNVGFDTLDAFAERHDITVNTRKHKALVGKGVVAGQQVMLVKPQTFMNLSGESVRDIIDFYKINEKSELIVISDDISLDVGRLRIRKKGSAGGHNGLKNIILHLGHDEFQRIRVGVGDRQGGHDLIDHVLGHFTRDERVMIDDTIGRAVEAIEVILADGADAAMNKFNGGIA